MAHELSIQKNGTVEAMFANHVAPWHGLGAMVDGAKSPLKALEIAHMNWTVTKAPLHVGKFEVQDKAAIIRTDNGDYLGTVGTDYQPIQNKEQAEFVEALCGEGNAVVECCGALRQGRRQFWTVKVPGELIIGNADKIENYMIVANGHDGSLAFRAFWSPIRVVCQNTLNIALKGAKEGVTIYHTKNAGDRVNDARRVLGIANEYYARMGETFTQMLEKEMSNAEFKLYADDVLQLKDIPSSEIPEQTRKVRTQLIQNFNEGVGVDLAGNSVWGAYNAVTEFVSHQRQTRGKSLSTSERQEKSFENIFFGTGKDLNQRAFDKALALV